MCSVNHDTISARWENNQRWYEAHLIQDLLGDWVVIRCWGGKGTNLQGGKQDVVSSYDAGYDMIKQIHKIRLKRLQPYWRVF